MAKNSAEKLGVFAPYGWDDATYMAGSLYELAITVFGYATSFLSAATKEEGVHFMWDASVVDGNRHSFKHWASDREQVVWFHLNPQKLEQAILVGCKNTLVALPHRITLADLPLLSKFDHIVCPTKQLYDSLKLKMVHDDLQYVPWDTHMPIMEKEGGRVSGAVRVLVPLDSPTARAIGPLVLHTLRVLLDGNPKAEVTVLYGKNWPQNALMALHELSDLHEDRVTCIKKPTYCKRVEAYRNTDWVFVPSVADNAGLPALDALACGAPVISFNAPPFNEFLTPFHNACLAKCETEITTMGAVQIKPNARELLDTLYEACANRSVLHMLKQRDWPEMESRRRTFQAFWKQAWSGLTEAN